MADTTPTDEPVERVIARYLTPPVIAELVDTTRAGERWAAAHPEAAARIRALHEGWDDMTEAAQEAAVRECVALLHAAVAATGD